MELVPAWLMAPVATAIQAMRGEAMINSVTIVVGVGDFARFGNARQLMAYLGLVPNFTEERVKRFARILESNESLIDDLWQLAV
jgi:transposase